MLGKVSIALLEPFYAFIIEISVSLLFRILHSLNHIQLPLSKVNIVLLRLFLLSNKAYDMFKSLGYLHIIIT